MGWRNSANLSDRCKGALPRIGSDPRSVPHQAACFFQAVDEVTGVQLLARGSLAGSQGGVVCEQLIDVGQLARRAAEVQQAHEGRAALGHLVDGGEGAMLGGQQLACGASCRRGENATLGDKIGQRVVVEAFRTQLFAARLIEGEALRIVGDNGDSPGSRNVYGVCSACAASGCRARNSSAACSVRSVWQWTSALYKSSRWRGWLNKHSTTRAMDSSDGFATAPPLVRYRSMESAYGWARRRASSSAF